MVMVSEFSRKEIVMMEVSRMVNFMVRESISGRMVIHIQEDGRMEIKKDEV
jgi:hypothetical protein